MDDEILRVAAEIGKLDQPIALLEALFASAPFPLQIYDATGQSVLTNRAFLDTYGSAPPPEYNVFRDEVTVQRGIAAMVRRAFAGEVVITPPHWYDPRELEHIHVTVGRRIHQVVTMMPLRDREDHVTHVAMFVRDLTAEIAALEEAEADRRRLDILADASASLSSTLESAQIARALVDLVVPRFCDACTVRLFDDGATEPAAPIDPRTLRAPVVGRTRPIGVVEFTMSESTRSFVAPDHLLARQLGERIGLALENARLYARAKQADRRKEEFLAVLGHELRNPLAPIVSAMQHMAQRGEGGSRREREVIERQISHMSRLVDDLLDVSRITRNKIELTKEPLELADVVAAAVELTNPLIHERHHTLHVAVPRGLVADVDDTRMTQVISNLLHNAAKYTGPGGRLEVVGSRDGDQIVIEVRDNGPGIPSAQTEAIFEMFVQVDRRHEGGLGIGLALVKGLVEMHGGSVTAHNATSGGAVFRLQLPGSTMVAPTETSRWTARTPIASRRILVVDDNPDALEMLVLTLTYDGHDVRTASDAQSALEVAAQQHPDVAILDIGLPEVDGYELARRIRARFHDPIRLIALTGYGQDDDRRASMAAGFDAHLVKPVQLDRLRREIASSVAVSR